MKACAKLFRVPALRNRGATFGLAGLLIASGALQAARPLFFEANAGADGTPSHFIARGHNYQFLVTAAEARIVLCKTELIEADPSAPLTRNAAPAAGQIFTRSIRMHFPGGNDGARLQGQGQMPGTINYLVGSDPARWQTGLSAFGKVRVDNVYDGIDLIYYGNEQLLEYDFVVSPEARPDAIAIQFDGVDLVEITEKGELALKVGKDEIRQPRPEIYQLVDGKRRLVTGGYRLKDRRTVGFEVGFYDRDLPLVIDPVLSYSTYFGGNFGDVALGVKVDADGFIYVAGQTLSTQFLFPFPGGYTNKFSGGKINGDAFVAKFDNQASSLVYFTYLGGAGNDGALDLAIDNNHHAYIAGFTDSKDFPVVPSTGVPGLPNHISGDLDPNLHVFPTDAFVAELSSNGTSFVYSTYLGGTLADVAGGIAVDPLTESAYVTGYTYSSNFPITSDSAFQRRLVGSNEVFVTQLAPNGAGLIYSTYLGGTNLDEGEGIAVDAAGLAYVTGYTASTNFPVTANAMQSLINRSDDPVKKFKGKNVPLDAFIAKFDTSKSGAASLVYCSLFGGTNNDAGFRIALDGSANAYITGNTSSPDFPNTNHAAVLKIGADGKKLLNFDAFLTKLSFDTNGAQISYSVLFGGKTNDVGWDVAVDDVGRAFVVGITSSKDFPTNNPSGFLRATNTGGNDVFVTAFDRDASALLYSVYLGGKHNDYGYGIALDAADNAYVVGQTVSTNFPTTAAFQSARNGTNDAFLAKILADIIPPPLTAVSAGPMLRLSWPAVDSEFSLESSTRPGVNSSWVPFSSGSVTVSNGLRSVAIPATGTNLFFRLKR